jgi:hypothetical protein
MLVQVVQAYSFCRAHCCSTNPSIFLLMYKQAMNYLVQLGVFKCSVIIRDLSRHAQTVEACSENLGVEHVEQSNHNQRI